MTKKPTKHSQTKRVLRDETRTTAALTGPGHLDQVPAMPRHLDQGSGHFDFPGGHTDLHLDLTLPRAEALEDPGLTVSLEMRKVLEKWIKAVSQRLLRLENEVKKLKEKKSK